MPHSSLWVLILLLLSACVTQEEIKNKESIEHLKVNLGNELTSSQKVTAEMGLTLQNMERDMAQTRESLELFEQSQNHEKERIDQLEKEQEMLKAELVETKKYLKTVTNILNSLKSGLKKSKISTSPFELGKNHYNKKKYQQSLEYFKLALESKKLARKKRNQSLMLMGLAAYELKRYEEALTYFSKVYPEQKKSPYATKSLLYIAKSLKQMGKKSMAREALQDFVQTYPRSRYLKQAKKELSKL